MFIVWWVKRVGLLSKLRGGHARYHAGEVACLEDPQEGI